MLVRGIMTTAMMSNMTMIMGIMTMIGGIQVQGKTIARLGDKMIL